MKNLLISSLLIVIHAVAFSQNSGRGFQFQAVARDADGLIRKNQQVELQFSLLAASNSIEAHWIEEHIVNTDAYGTFSLIVGEGIKNENSLYADFSNISFLQQFWLKVEIRDDGSWFEISNQKLLSVPYAENMSPLGTIEIFAGDSSMVPYGYMLCDGRELDSTSYPHLYRIIGTNWGNSSGVAGKFNIPDLRGVFIRGTDYSIGKDPDRLARISLQSGGNTADEVGSYQNDVFKKHTHAFTHDSYSHRAGGGSNNNNVPKSQDGINNDPKNTGSTGGNETRPKNVYVNYIIRVQ